MENVGYPAPAGFGTPMNATGDFTATLDAMDEEAKKAGNFFKMGLVDQKFVTFTKDPVKGLSSYDTKNQTSAQGQPVPAPAPGQAARAPRTVFFAYVKEDGNEQELQWEIGNKSVMTQIVAIARQFKLRTLVGARMMIKTSGSDMKNRQWFVMLVSAPGIANNQFMAPAPAPVPTPVNAPVQIPQATGQTSAAPGTPQSLTPTGVNPGQQPLTGEQWLDQQRAGAK